MARARSIDRLSPPIDNLPPACPLLAYLAGILICLLFALEPEPAPARVDAPGTLRDVDVFERIATRVRAGESFHDATQEQAGNNVPDWWHPQMPSNRDVVSGRFLSVSIERVTTRGDLRSTGELPRTPGGSPVRSAGGRRS